MNGNHKKKTVLVTGGVRGIGLAISTAFVKKGYTVYATYSKDEQSAEKARAQGVIALRSDIRKEEEIVALFQKIGDVDILVNNAGVASRNQIQDVTAEELDELYAVNFRGAFLCSREASKSMISNRSGLIVNISSVWGEIGGSCETAYSATKAALIGFTKALAKELGYSLVRVCCVSPGVIKTRMLDGFSQEDLSLIQEDIPLGKLGDGEEIAKTVLFLEENDYITGVDIPVNGGFSVC